MQVYLQDETQRLLRKRVEAGQFPNEEAVVNAALKRFLTEDSPEASSDAIEFREERLPGPFLEDEAVLALIDLPRHNEAVALSCQRVEFRYPDLFPGE